MFDGKLFGQEMVGIVKAHVERSLDPVIKRIEAIEAKFLTLPTPKDGKDADPAAVAEIVAEDLRRDISALHSALNALPKAAELPDIPAMVAEAIEAAKPIDIKALVDEAVAAIPPAEKGKDADPELVASLVKETVERAVATLPVPKDGQDGAPGQNGKDGAPGRDGVDGKNGLDAVKFFRGDKGNLLVSMSNGQVDDIGEIDGRDGIDGKDGAPGLNGKDGADGLGFDDADISIEDEGVMIRFVRGDVVKKQRLPVPIDRGVFKEGRAYLAGDGVSFGGSWFIAQEDTTEKPETGKGWRLAVKRGRDGKDGEMKPQRDPKPVKVG